MTHKQQKVRSLPAGGFSRIASIRGHSGAEGDGECGVFPGYSSVLLLGGEPYPNRRDRIQCDRAVSNATGTVQRSFFTVNPNRWCRIQNRRDRIQTTGIVSKATGIVSEFPNFFGGPSAGRSMLVFRCNCCPDPWAEGGGALLFPSLIPLNPYSGN